MAAKKRPAKAKRPRGRPTIYSDALVGRICAEMAKGRSLKKICDDTDMPGLTTVFRWLGEADHSDFRDNYAKARQAQADLMAEDLLEIADDGKNDWMERNGNFVVNGEVVARSRLRVDTRKWLLAKLHPQKYAELTKAEHSGPGGGPIETKDTSDLELARRIAFALAKVTKTD